MFLWARTDRRTWRPPEEAATGPMGRSCCGAPIGREVVGSPGREPLPLRYGASGRPHWHRRPLRRAGGGPVVGAVLGPAGGRVLPRLLAAVGREVHQRVGVVHGLDAAQRRPVGLEDPLAVAEVADEV